MKNTGLAIQSVGRVRAYHIGRTRARAHTHNGGLGNPCHIRHSNANFGGSAGTHIPENTGPDGCRHTFKHGGRNA